MYRSYLNTVKSVSSTNLEVMRVNEYNMIAYDDLKTYIDLVFLFSPYFACARPGSNLLKVHVGRSCVVRKYS